MKKIFAIVVVAMAAVFSCVTANAQETKKVSPWVEVQQVDIPAGQNIQEGVTKNGNPKFWFTFKTIGDVTVSPGSASKYKKGEVTLVLVKWENKENGKFRYTIRQKERAISVTPNVDLNNIF